MKISGVSQTLRNINKFSIDINKAVNKGVIATGYQVRNTAVKSIQEVSQGERVERQRQSGSGTYSHTASKPGDAPNTDTGALVRSVAVESQNDGVAFVGSSLKYAGYLEFGTKHMDARPWLNPALDANIKNLPGNIESEIERQINEL